MKITKILNNNVVISKINGEERIVMGAIIAFGKKNGQAIEKDKIDKIFRMTSDEQERMLTLINELDDDVLLISQEIIVEANKLYKEPLSESIYIALTDHINYAIKRHKEGTVIILCFMKLSDYIQMNIELVCSVLIGWLNILILICLKTKLALSRCMSSMRI